MEKDVTLSPIAVIIKGNSEGSLMFQLEDPAAINKQINSDLLDEYAEFNNGSILIQPDQNIIDGQKVCIDTSSLFT